MFVETPGQGVKEVLPEGIEEDLGWNTAISYQGGYTVKACAGWMKIS